MSLFQLGEFKAHSDEILQWKIECDALTPQDMECLAFMISGSVGWFTAVEGVPNGGLMLASYLEPYAREGTLASGPLLLVDDVLTTGKSMEEHRSKRSPTPWTIGAVIFARGPCPKWITPLFQMHQ